MKKVILILLFLLLSFELYLVETQCIIISKMIEIEEHTKQLEWEELITKIIYIESDNGINVIGDNGKAIGPLQIHKILVDDVNRILGYKHYIYKDRYNLEKSIEMFNIYQQYYNPNKDIESAAKLWNGGPHYYKYPKVESYWRKINNVNIQ